MSFWHSFSFQALSSTSYRRRSCSYKAVYGARSASGRLKHGCTDNAVIHSLVRKRRLRKLERARWDVRNIRWILSQYGLLPHDSQCPSNFSERHLWICKAHSRSFTLSEVQVCCGGPLRLPKQAALLPRRGFVGIRVLVGAEQCQTPNFSFIPTYR